MRINSKRHRQQTDAAIRRSWKEHHEPQPQPDAKGVQQLRAERFAAVTANSYTRDQLIEAQPTVVYDGRHEQWMLVRQRSNGAPAINQKTVSVQSPLLDSDTWRLPFDRITGAR